ncbi:hypothetical protein [Oscillatoria sp. FACHB-1406]|uniref:hypothetical protein n=1 Tax=Oscillatoria sp. FACHB-1406 TaxID=2692846 RepID=UPI001685F192|nr:hypothetical protein [Oscillatoria sp. FACHB-1406]MBD2578215.1 hypothetical protein [Oscillatoria sp. FACHB-1406]
MDNSILTLFSVRGNRYFMPIWGASGRFFPLGHQEFNIVRLFSKTPFSYHLFAVLQLLIFLPVTFIFLRRCQIGYRLPLLLIVTTAPSFVIPFFGLVYPERNIIFFLIFFFLFLNEFNISKSRWSFCGALIAAQFTLYYKEPVFILISSFALSRLLLNFPSQEKSYSCRKMLNFAKQQWLDSSLIILSLIYILLYAIVTIPNLGTPYAADIVARNTELMVLGTYLEYNPLLLIFGLVFIVRIANVAIAKKAFDRFWDPLALGTLLYGLAYIKLKLISMYYMAPVDFLGILYLGWVCNKLLKTSTKKISLILFGIIFIGIFIRNLSISSSEILNSKKYEESNIQLVEFLKNYSSQNRNRDSVSLLFPSNSNYEVMEFSSFMDYQGLKLHPRNYHKMKAIERERSAWVVKTQKPLKEDKCMLYAPYKCYYFSAPEPGNLMVFLPKYNGTANGRNIDRIKNESEMIFQYQPSFSALEKVLRYWAGPRRIAKDWMNLYVFKVD